MGGVPSFDGKRNAVGMLTKIKISIAHGVLAGLGVTSQATAKISITKLGNLAISLVRQIKKFFHGKILAQVCTKSSHLLFASLEGLIFGGYTFFDGKSPAVGMQTQTSKSIDHGILARCVVAHQAFVIKKATKFGNLAISLVWLQILTFFHVKMMSFNFQSVKIPFLRSEENGPLPFKFIPCSESRTDFLTDLTSFDAT